MTSDEWLAARRDYITATDVAAVLAPYGHNDRQLAIAETVARKLAEPSPPTDAMAWGLMIEELAPQWYERLNETYGRNLALIRAWDLLPVVGGRLCTRMIDGVPGGATIDWLAIDRDKTDPQRSDCFVVEVKHTAVALAWGEKPPRSVLAQVQWQLLVTGLARAEIMACVGGRAPMVYRVKRGNPSGIVAAAKQLWAAYKTAKSAAEET